MASRTSTPAQGKPEGAARAIRSRLGRLVSEEALGRWVFYIPVVFLVLFYLIPISLTFVWSFFERTMFWMKPAFSFDNYVAFFGTARLDNYITSMGDAGIAVVVSFVLGFPIAVFIRRRLPEVAQHRALLLFILPFMISELIRVFALRPVLGRYGIVNNLLMDIGIISEPISELLFTSTAVIIGQVLSFLPFMVFSGFLALEAVQRYVFEICEDLGASTFSTFKDVIVPLGAPGIFAGAVFIFVNGIGGALIDEILGGAGSVNAGLLVLDALTALNFPLAMAISAIIILTLLILLFIGHKLFNLTRILEPIS